MIERKIFECEHCRKKRMFKKANMLKHEEICWYNAKNKTCVTCKFGEIRYDSETNDTTRKCYKNNKKELLENIKPVVNCEFWKCSEEYKELDEEIENTELITNEFIKRVATEFNKLNYWCSLAFLEDTEILCLLDKETGNLQELLGKDDIERIELKNNKLNIEFDEDKNGFTACTINEFGIEY